MAQRQRERDIRFLFPLMSGLTEAQQQLIFNVQGFLLADRPDNVALVDEDVVQATKALADTYDTASRGIIYDHGAALPVAGRLSGEIKALIETHRSEGLRIGDADISATLRRIETGAREAREALMEQPRREPRSAPSGKDPKTAFLRLLKRVLRSPQPVASDTESAPARGGHSRLIVPG